MTILNKFSMALSLSVICVLCAVNASAQVNVNGPSAFQYSVLPETMVSPPDVSPNIMIIVDTSASMRFDSTSSYAPAVDAEDCSSGDSDCVVTAAQPGGAASPNSRSFRVREGILAALAELELTNIPVNIGIATFGNDGLNFAGPNSPRGSSILDCNGYVELCAPHTGLTDHIYYRDLTGGGTILSGLSPLNSTLLTTLNTLLATEPEQPDFGENPSTAWVESSHASYFEVAEGTHLLTGNGNLLYDGTLTSVGSTPLRGSLTTVGKYYTGAPIALAGSELPFGSTLPIPPPLTQLVAGANTQCVPNTYIFMLTDGQPTMNPSGGGVGSVSGEVTAVAAEAQRLRTDYGIETWVFGFELGNTEQGYMNTIAAGGSATQGAFLSSTADQLKTQLLDAIQSIDSITASASGISVVASQSEGAGLVAQALFDPVLKREVTTTDSFGDTTTEEQEVSWSGTINGVFIDEFGLLREDSDGDGILDDYSVDTAFEMLFNGATLQVDVNRLAVAADGTQTVTSTVGLKDIEPIWSAADVLNAYPTNAIYGSEQRPYTSVASDTDGYRHIFSWMADNPNNLDELHLGTKLDFMFTDNAVATTINAKNFLMFDPRSTDIADQKLEVSEIIRFIRGEEGIPGLRSRTLFTDKFLLGDIVHSNAAQVGAPSSNFDLQNDDSYTEFKEAYQNRRRMVYVGANDGLLHGFNAGFWEPENKQFHESPYVDGEIGAVHALGAEIWAFAPMNLLPHLKFLTEQTYRSNMHVAFMDGAVKSYDVRAWDENDIDHVNGWGTIIVAGMRFGGGDYADLDWDAVNGGNANYTSRSGYVILDVTDPEQPPEVIAEVIHPDMGFSLSIPTVSRTNCVTTGGDIECDWHLVMGSGPTELATSTSTQLPRVFRYKLDHNDWGFEEYAAGGGVTEQFKTFGNNNAFTGDLGIADWNSDYEHDVVYFGSVGGTELAATGGVHRFQLNGASANTITTLINTSNPVPYRPIMRRQAGKEWVMFGTGRFLTIDDVLNTERNWFYGVIEPRDAAGELTYPTTLSPIADLVDVTGIEVAAADGALSLPVEGTTNFGELKAYILDSTSSKNRGWRKQLNDVANLADPSRKVSAAALTFRNFLFYTDYLPPISDGNACTNEFGSSDLNVVDISTGTATFFSSPNFDGPLGVDTNTGDIITNIVLGAGYANESYIFPRKNPATGKPEVLIKTPLNTGVIKDTVLALPPQLGGRASWRELEIQ